MYRSISGLSPSIVKIGVAIFEALQLGINSGELLAQEERLLLLRQ
jgi:hypothetical protein